ncbi:MAG: prepilin-type N-terminal cleavage/methylation domain-containing protein [Bacilli bacterium]|nr:prepilin-type N-terminal cleavage/methylation domain-containing protein [Bacilli bacterium]
MKRILQAWNGKSNNKGMTLVEIIISIALITIVLVFLFSLLITVNDINKESEVNSTYLVNKSLILKNIQGDLSKFDSIQLSSCNIKDFYTTYESDRGENIANDCLEITYKDDVNPAYLAIYYYENQNDYVISYIHGNVKSTRKLPEFEKYNVDADSLKKEFIYNGEVTDGFYTITIPIIGSDGKDYSIIISYYGTVKIET